MTSMSAVQAKVAELIDKQLPVGEYDDVTWQLTSLVMEMAAALAGKDETEREKRTQWDECDVQFLGQLMVQASELANQVDDLNMYCPPGQHGPNSDRDLVDDAKYHARKVVTIISHLAIKASHEYDEAHAG